MNLEQIREKNRGLESSIGWKAKRELIRSIQEKRGNAPCFQMGKARCDQFDCSWRNDCKPGERKART